VLDVLKFIHSTAWPFLFGKPANDLQQANAADDEYMITDHDLLVGGFFLPYGGRFGVPLRQRPRPAGGRFLLPYGGRFGVPLRQRPRPAGGRFLLPYGGRCGVFAAAHTHFTPSHFTPQVGRYISVPRSYATFVPGSIVAGIVRGMLDAAGFPAQ
jgi:hypothetical protein